MMMMALGVAYLCAGSVASSSSAFADDSPGRGLARSGSSDFNGDGFADLAASEGQAEFDEGYVSPGGSVHVMYGSSDGLTAAGRQVWTPESLGRGGDHGRVFGNGLAVGDFDGDGYSDLGIGDGEGGDDSRGLVQVLYGSPVGLTVARRQTWSQASPGVKGRTSYGFGAALVAANFGKSPHDDLAVGGGLDSTEPGRVNVLYGSAAGLSAAGDQLWSQNTRGIRGRSEHGDLFGAVLAAGHFTDGPYADLVVGVPGEDVGRIRDAGAAHIIYGSAAGLSARRSQLWTQNSSGIRGKAARLDAFGSSMASGRFAGRSRDDLAIGAPGGYDGEGRSVGGGAVNVIYSSARGLVTRHNQLLTQESNGIPGRTEGGDLFGVSLAAGNLGRDGAGNSYEDLAVGVPGEMVNDERLGRVYVLYGAAGGLDGARRETLYGTEALPEDDYGSSFGGSLAVADFGRNANAAPYADLAVGRAVEVETNDVVEVFYATSAGLAGSFRQDWRAGAEFGAFLAAG
jgi:hypothetical protein